MTDQIGQRLGNYTLLRLLGKGGFAEVYLGEHVYLKSLAAIKVLLTQLGQEDTDRFISEARLLMGLRHPNIVRVLEFGVEQDIPFLVMDYAPHGTLRQRYPKGTRLAPAVVATYVRQIASALQYAHNQKLIHRDVKPENLLFHNNDEVLLSDFGIALIAQTSRLQSNQGVIGTATYMAPEQIQGKATVASDQYSLGIIAYEWLSGKSPFQGSFSEVCAQHVLTPPTPLHQTVPMLLPAIENVVLTALAKEPQKRFPSVEAFATALEQVCRQGPSTLTAPTYPSSSLVKLIPSQEWEATFVRRPPAAQPSSPLHVMGKDSAWRTDKNTALTTKENFSFHVQENRSSIQENRSSARDQNRSLAAQPIPQPVAPRRSLPVNLIALFLILAASLTGGLGFLFYAFSHQPQQVTITATRNTGSAPTTASQPTSTTTLQPTPTAAPQTTNSPAGVLTLDDTLSTPNANKWDVFTYSGNVGGCSYTDGAYHATMKQAGTVSLCTAHATNFSNFTYQVNMTILSGTASDGGGLIFRSASGKSYRFRVSTDGSFDLVADHTLIASSSSAIKTGLNQTNVLKVKAQDTTISIYVNNVLLANITNSASSTGTIGVFAVDFTQPTDVAFSNAQVWQS